jgi:hypothetical protein
MCWSKVAHFMVDRREKEKERKGRERMNKARDKI